MKREEIEAITGVIVLDGDSIEDVAEGDTCLVWRNQPADFGQDLILVRYHGKETTNAFATSQLLEGRGVSLQDWVDKSVIEIKEHIENRLTTR